MLILSFKFYHACLIQAQWSHKAQNYQIGHEKK